MSQPTPYTPATDFTDYQDNNPGVDFLGTDIDAELAAIELTTDEILENLALLQRDDGALANATVTADALAASALALLESTGEPRGDWVTATAYAAKDLVTESGVTYICVIAHTSGTFATDLAADKWMFFAGVPAGVGDVVGPAGGATDGLPAVFSGTTGKVLKVATAAAIRASLGATSVGGSLFTAASESAARTTVRALGQDQTEIFGTTGGTANQQTLTLTPALPALVAGQKVRIIGGSGLTNTTAMTLNISGLGDTAVKLIDGSACIGGEVRDGKVTEMVYTGSVLVITASYFARGTFSPTLVIGSGSVTPDIAFGSYERDGNMVDVNITVSISGSSTPSGNLTVTGLPFLSENVTNQNWIFRMGPIDGSSFLLSASGSTFWAILPPNSTTLKLIATVDNTGGAGSAGGNIASGARGAVINGRYRTAA
jgi:hypothetical protein